MGEFSFFILFEALSTNKKKVYKIKIKQLEKKKNKTAIYLVNIFLYPRELLIFLYIL